MPWNVRAGPVLPIAIVATVVLLENCTHDKPFATESDSPMRLEEGPPNAPLKDGIRPQFSVFVQGGDSSNEVCQGGERCAIQGNEYSHQIRITCTGGPGNCGNPSYTWSMVNTPSGVTVTFDPPTTLIEEWTLVSIKPDSSATTGVYPTAISTVPHFDGPDYPYTTHVMCSYNYQHCPEIEIVDVTKDSVVSAPKPTQTTVIGKQMHLWVRHKEGTGSGMFNITHTEWTIGGDSLFTEFDVVSNTLTRLDQGAFNDDTEVKYYHSIGHTGNPIHVKATVHGPTGDTQQEASATYDVEAAAYVTMVSQTVPGGVVIAPDVGSAWPLLIRFGSLFFVNQVPILDSVGILYDFSATVPEPGYFGVTQIVTGIAARSAGIYYNVERARDGCPFYRNHWVRTDSTLRDADAPNISLDSIDLYAVQANTFRTYFMYRPDGAYSAWVPIGALDWQEGGLAERDTTAAYKWDMLESYADANPSGGVSSEFPTTLSVMPDSIFSSAGCPSGPP